MKISENKLMYTFVFVILIYALQFVLTADKDNYKVELKNSIKGLISTVINLDETKELDVDKTVKEILK